MERNFPLILFSEEKKKLHILNICVYQIIRNKKTNYVFHQVGDCLYFFYENYFCFYRNNFDLKALMIPQMKVYSVYRSLIYWM